AERQRRDDDEGEDRRAAQRTRRITQIADGVVQPVDRGHVMFLARTCYENSTAPPKRQLSMRTQPVYRIRLRLPHAGFRHEACKLVEAFHQELCGDWFGVVGCEAEPHGARAREPSGERNAIGCKELLAALRVGPLLYDLLVIIDPEVNGVTIASRLDAGR